MCRYIESIKVEKQKFHLLDLHQKRVSETFKNFGKQQVLNLGSIVKQIIIPDDKLYKLRIIYDLSDYFEVEFVPYITRKIESFELINGDGIDYHFKSENRDALENAKTHSGFDEVIFLQKNNITDTSFSNLAFLKNGMWFTPKTYLLNGVQRQNIIAENRILESEINVQNLMQFSHFQIINSMNDLDNSNIYSIDRIKNLSDFCNIC